jgi:3-isopropylmalate/(R)-2-methylmalate dehydratase large subunit
VGAKDLILAVIAELGIGGATGCVIEYAGEAITALDMEGRMTVCNMSIEAGARAGMIAPDETTIDWLRGRPHAPQERAFDEAAEAWRALRSDPGARFDRELRLDSTTMAPMATWGVTPDAAAPVGARVPANDSGAAARDYMGVAGDQPLSDMDVDVVFVGSCTNGRLGDLRMAAQVLRGRRVHDGVRMLVVPGSETVRRAAEAEGLHEVFLAAGAEWRLPGCSMCIAMNGDLAPPGQRVVSTSNRNFEGRQGPGSRTVLAGPAVAAASAIEGRVADPRPYLEVAHA